FVKLLSKANFSYGCVSFGLIATGLVFTVFAIFQKDSQIGKVWLAGPTTMVVGLVLCGKVIIDWGPAMLHARDDYIDSRFIEHYATFHMPEIVDPLINKNRFNHQSTHYEPRCNGSVMTSSIKQQLGGTGETVALLDQELLHPNPHYLILSQRCLSANEYNVSAQKALGKFFEIPHVNNNFLNTTSVYYRMPSLHACKISLCQCIENAAEAR
ncbi:hypothetical protein Angca_001967, partial [Angiostrongylus cantonensis]